MSPGVRFNGMSLPLALSLLPAPARRFQVWVETEKLLVCRFAKKTYPPDVWAGVVDVETSLNLSSESIAKFSPKFGNPEDGPFSKMPGKAMQFLEAMPSRKVAPNAFVLGAAAAACWETYQICGAKG